MEPLPPCATPAEVAERFKALLKEHGPADECERCTKDDYCANHFELFALSFTHGPALGKAGDEGLLDDD